MPHPLTIVADENIPWVEEAFGSLGSVTTCSGRAITQALVPTADVLLVRSVTRVDAALLAGSRVQFVGSATIGTDHIDHAHLAEHGIAFAHAPGSNADSVVEYVLSALLHLAVTHNEPLRGKTVGLVGCGNIGGRLAQRLPALGLHVLRNDPPLAAQTGSHDFVELDQVLAAADIISLHVPLTRTGPHATYHLFDEAVLQRLSPNTWLLNTCRGPVVDNAALLQHIKAGRLAATVLDVWETEPDLSTPLLGCVDLGTPHIAGYSYDGKVTGTVMLYEALLAHLQHPSMWNSETIYAPTPEDELALEPPSPTLSEHAWLHHLTQQMYSIAEDDGQLRHILTRSEAERGAYFTHLRKTYPRRRAFGFHHIPAAEVPKAYRKAVQEGFGIQLSNIS